MTDVSSFETEWVRISKPYPISLTLKQIRNILSTDYMDVDCFNVAVRVLANNPVNCSRVSPVQFLDLKFCTMSKLARDTVCREMLDIDQLAQLFRAWPESDWYHISDYDTIYLPYEIYGIYMLFVFDLKKKIVYILDLLSISSWGLNLFKTMETANNLNMALKVENPE